MIIKVSDLRAAFMCRRGAVKFFKRHNLDWSKFLKEGLPEEEIAATGDAMALRVIEVAHERRK